MRLTLLPFRDLGTRLTRARERSLIGEHIDYVLFGCFPAAIERDILIACGPSKAAAAPEVSAPGGVNAHNLDPKYKPQAFVPMLKSAGPTAAEEADAAATVHAESAWYLDIDKRELRWESYVKAGYYVSVLLIRSSLLAVLFPLRVPRRRHFAYHGSMRATLAPAYRTPDFARKSSVFVG